MQKSDFFSLFKADTFKKGALFKKKPSPRPVKLENPTIKDRITGFILGAYLGLLGMGILAIFVSVIVEENSIIYFLLKSSAIYNLILAAALLVLVSFLIAAKINFIPSEVKPQTAKFLKRFFILFIYPLTSIWLATGSSKIFTFYYDGYKSEFLQQELFYYFWLLVVVIYFVPIILGLLVRAIRGFFSYQTKKTSSVLEQE